MFFAEDMFIIDSTHMILLLLFLDFVIVSIATDNVHPAKRPAQSGSSLILFILLFLLLFYLALTLTPCAQFSSPSPSGIFFSSLPRSLPLTLPRWHILRLVAIGVFIGALCIGEALGLVYLALGHFGPILSILPPPYTSPYGMTPRVLQTFSFTVIFFFAMGALLSTRERRFFFSSMPSWQLLLAIGIDAIVVYLISTLGLPFLGILPVYFGWVLVTIGWAAVFSMINDVFKVAFLQILVKSQEKKGPHEKKLTKEEKEKEKRRIELQEMEKEKLKKHPSRSLEEVVVPEMTEETRGGKAEEKEKEKNANKVRNAKKESSKMKKSDASEKKVEETLSESMNEGADDQSGKAPSDTEERTGK